jgi:outer membrane protein TolC
MVGISLPFAPWTIGRASGEVDEARAEINMRKATYRNTTNMVLFAVKEAYTNVETAERFVNLYKDSVLPQAEQSLNAAVAAYKTQQADFLSLLDSYRTLRVFQLEYYEALANYHRNLAALDRAVGHHAKDDRDTVDHDKN